MTIVFAAGGTGGHLIPAIAIAEALRRRSPQVGIVFVGIGKPIEKKLLERAGFEHVVIPFVPVSGGGVRSLARSAAAFPRALRTALALYRARTPALVAGFGGYPSFVPMAAAALLGIPRVLHEQNVKVGLANKLLSLLGKNLFAVTGAHGFWSHRPVHHLPNPVRDAFLRVGAWSRPAPGGHFTIVVSGGSQGAVRVNDAVLASAPALEALPVHLIHQTGERDLERVRERYRSFPKLSVQTAAFFDEMAPLYESAHLVISRAGAMTAAEIAAAGRPAIYVPLAIAGGHQAENVAAQREAGTALVIEQDEQLDTNLQKALLELFENGASKLEQLGARATANRFSEAAAAADDLAERFLAVAARRPDGNDLLNREGEGA